MIFNGKTMRPIIFSLFLIVIITAAGSLAFAGSAAKEENV
jgi:hypothetical protein